MISRSRILVALALVTGCADAPPAPTEAVPSSQARAVVSELARFSVAPTGAISWRTDSDTPTLLARSNGLDRRITRAEPHVTLSAGATAPELDIAVSGRRVHTAEAIDGWIVQRAADAGADVVWRATEHGVEDYQLWRERPVVEAVRYEIAIRSGVAGLRQVGNVVELLDAGGIPRWRMANPVVVDATRMKRAAAISIDGCEVDRSASPPWRRAPTPPGATRCSLEISWATSGAVYPAVLDPKWETTASMAYSRANFTLTRLPDGTVLAVGGGNATAEIFNVSSLSWAVSGNLITSRDHHTATLLPDGSVVVAGGGSFQTPIASAEIWDPVSGNFSATTLNSPRTRHAATRLNDGRALVIGGSDGVSVTASGKIYDPVLASWSDAPPMGTPRYDFTLTLLPDGKVLAIGGSQVLGIKTAELFDGASWKGVPNPPVARVGHTATLSGSRVVVAGGAYEGSSSFDIYDTSVPAAPWSGPFSLTTSRFAHGAALLPNGRVILIGGTDTDTLTQPVFSTDLVDPMSASIEPGPKLVKGRAFFPTAELLTGQVLAAGGSLDAMSAELLTLDKQGEPCTKGANCSTGRCVDGVCCDKPCTGKCSACSAAKKGAGVDGVCDFVVGGIDPHGDCSDQGALSCGTDGTCDGSGACRLYSAGAPCGLTTCVSNVQTGFACDGKGSCLSDSKFDCQLALCKQGACANPCVDGTDCVTSAWCNAGTCEAEKTNGLPCTAKEQCQSTVCSDGVCCNAPCTGQCESCNLPNTEGKCIAVKGAAAPGRTACAAAGPGSPCTARACDGVERAQCAGFVGDEVSCHAPACTGDQASSASTCDGTGSCPDPVVTPCAPYACAATDCKSACKAAADCGADATCDVSTGTCVIAATCADAQTLRHADGKLTSCKPFACQGGACRTECGSLDDCATDYSCDSKRQCVANSSSASDDNGGCGCRSAPSGAPRSTPFWIVLLVIALRGAAPKSKCAASSRRKIRPASTGDRWLR